MNNFSQTLKSNKTDQLNAYDLLSESITITITRVEIKLSDNQNQNAWIYYQGSKSPYKPNLTMRRLIGELWGFDNSEWIGRKMTLFCDKSVSFGEAKNIGGIRISHLSNIKSPCTVYIKSGRAGIKGYYIQPIAELIDCGKLLNDINNTQSEEELKALAKVLTQHKEDMSNEQAKRLGAAYNAKLQSLAPSNDARNKGYI